MQPHGCELIAATAFYLYFGVMLVVWLVERR